MSSRRLYATATEINAAFGFTPTDAQMDIAESLIDSYVGFQEKFLCHPITGRAAAGGAASITLEVSQQNLYELDYFKYCEVEIIGGTGAGQRRTVSTNVKASGLVTVSANWDTVPDATSIYRIYQLGKFPREKDAVFYSSSAPFAYAKSIPDAVRQAAMAQVEYMHNMGDTFFGTDKADKVSEDIGDYSYENAASGVGVTGVSKFIAPKAKLLLKGIRNVTGRLIY